MRFLHLKRPLFGNPGQAAVPSSFGGLRVFIPAV
jgi:hypothetical protein